ncbi:hypothetical protein [Macrococcus epidermidis]|uniref:hypothetical protein n=1 Tax=Macrococcus epidermidis TaxID=1902580 RepID=UPI0020B83DD2|nr:hypothetical protein [Macrococcus epidermidis]UTH17267.1 hypothetical protein KFV12_05735 [Macrococcus epidermidis]
MLRTIILSLLAVVLFFLTMKQVNQSHLDTWFLLYFLVYVSITLVWNNEKTTKKRQQNYNR